MMHDAEMLEAVRRILYTPVVGDILDHLGYYHQFLPPEIRPIRDEFVVAGRAMPVITSKVSGPQERPFGLLTEALDQIQPNEVYMATGTYDCAGWGEILTATARVRGGMGAVIDGFHRDTRQVLAQNWPVFSRGGYAQDASVRMAVTAYRVPIEIDGVQVRPGDVIFGDVDGVLVVPHEVEEEVVGRALEKARSEKVVRMEIESGASSTEVFRKYGLL